MDILKVVVFKKYLLCHIDFNYPTYISPFGSKVNLFQDILKFTSFLSNLSLKMTPKKFYKTKCMQSIILLPKISFVDAHLTVLFNSPNPGNFIAMLSLILTHLTPVFAYV